MESYLFDRYHHEKVDMNHLVVMSFIRYPTEPVQRNDYIQLLVNKSTSFFYHWMEFTKSIVLSEYSEAKTIWQESIKDEDNTEEILWIERYSKYDDSNAVL